MLHVLQNRDSRLNQAKRPRQETYTHSRFLTKKIIDTNVLICVSKFSFVVVISKSFVYLRLLTNVRIVGGQICGGKLGDAWWSNLPSSVCQVSNSSKICPLCHGILASGSAYPWSWVLLVIFCLWVARVLLCSWFAFVCVVVGGQVLWAFGALRWQILHWWKRHPILPLLRMTWLLRLFVRYQGGLHCWRVCHPFQPWTCVRPCDCKILVWISMMSPCVLPWPCCLRGRWVLHPPASRCNPRNIYIAALFSLLGLPLGKQVSWALGVVLRQLHMQGKEILLRIPPEWISFQPCRGQGNCLLHVNIAFLPHMWAWHEDMVDPAIFVEEGAGTGQGLCWRR